MKEQVSQATTVDHYVFVTGGLTPVECSVCEINPFLGFCSLFFRISRVALYPLYLM